jgi:hypothetical protein
MVLIIAAVLTLVGVFLNWASFTFDASGLGEGSEALAGLGESTSGIETSDGKIALVCALIAGAIGFAVMKGKGAAKVLSILALLAMLAVAALGAYNVTSVKDDAREGFIQGFTKSAGAGSEQFAEQFADRLDVSVGVGLYATLAGGILGLVGSIMGLMVKTPTPTYGSGIEAPPMAPGGMPPMMPGEQSPPGGGMTGMPGGMPPPPAPGGGMPPAAPPASGYPPPPPGGSSDPPANPGM